MNIRITQHNKTLITYKYGDNISNNKKSHKGRYAYFDLILEPNTQYEIYTELYGTGLISTKLVMIDNVDFLEKNIKEVAVITLYLGLMFLLIYYNTLHYLALKNQIFNIYTIYIITMIGSQLGTHGYLFVFHEIIPPMDTFRVCLS